MANAQQSTKPSIFLPYLRTAVAEAISLPENYVRIIARPDPGRWAYMTNDKAVGLYLQPEMDIPNAGAGRNGTPVSQVLEVYLRTRKSLADQPGGNESSLPAHLDAELQIVNALHLVHLVDSGNRPLFIMPLRMIPSGEPVQRKEVEVGALESVFRFRLDYVLQVTTVT